MGASALDLCAVADGRFDAYVDFDGNLGPWDYLGALLICAEVGIETVDADGRDLTVIDHGAPIAGGGSSGPAGRAPRAASPLPPSTSGARIASLDGQLRRLAPPGRSLPAAA
ncbi:MAG: inositol monophosphatase family protein [Acidimicrobiales bacterium]